jgi:ribonuclease HII
MLVLGIDDAGRGPAIGPMILAGVLVDDTLIEELRGEGVKDSKLLNPMKREALAEIIKKKSLSYKVKIITPKKIDNSINGGVNLNRLEAVSMAEIVNKINETAIDNIKVIVDCPSPNIRRWGKVLKNKVKNKENLNIVCEHKADLNYIPVAAASILAKSFREKEVKKIKEKLGVDFGSGYTSDEKTRKFIEKNYKKFRDKGIFRKTWSTFSNSVKKKEQKNLRDY